MSNYTKSTNFTALTAVNAVINGAAYDLEYGAIATAIASKFDNLAGGYAGPFTMTYGTGTTLTVNGGNGSNALAIVGNSATGGSYGLIVTAGTNNTDRALLIRASGGVTPYLEVYGDGGVTLGTPTGGDPGIGNINISGTYQVNGVASGFGSVIVKNLTSASTRTSTTTLTNDATMQYAVPSAGTYRLKAVLGITTGAGGININVNYSGTQTNSMATYVGGGASGLGQAVNATVNSSGLGISGAISNVGVTIDAVLVASGTGTVAIAWAQFTSNATASQLLAGSTFTVERIA
jgi:hypothetical protein